MANTAAMKRLAAMVANRLQVKRVHRIRTIAVTITQGASTNVNLLTCDDDPDYDLTTDGTSVAECQPGARIIAVQLQMMYRFAEAGEECEWIIGRDPDAFLGSAAVFNIATLYTSDVTANTKLIRANVWGAGSMISSTNRESSSQHINISRKALKRARLMADNDVVRMNFTRTAGSFNDSLYLRGRIITRGP